MCGRKSNVISCISNFHQHLLFLFVVVCLQYYIFVLYFRNSLTVCLFYVDFFSSKCVVIINISINPSLLSSVYFDRFNFSVFSLIVHLNPPLGKYWLITQP